MMMQNHLELFDDNPEYTAFVDKFKPKKTTDDCYTPPYIYDVVRDWACKKYAIDPKNIVRPFYPGGDYEHFSYPDNCVVLDNPPFSIFAKICDFYLTKKISFFLFFPSLKTFSARKIILRMNHIFCDAKITYENGAVVPTAFVTSFGGDIVAQTAPDLGNAINAAVKKNKTKKQLSRYVYPDNVVTASMLQNLSKNGVNFSIHRDSATFIPGLDAQKPFKKTIFGGGLLISDKAANEKHLAERAAAERAVERAAAERQPDHIWELSEKEKTIVAGLV